MSRLLKGADKAKKTYLSSASKQNPTKENAVEKDPVFPKNFEQLKV